MRNFTPEEKELIVNTKITIDCFEKWNDYHYEQIRLEHFPHPSLKKGKTCTAFLYPTTIMESLVIQCEEVRTKYLETKAEHYFDILIHLLPNSYKVVNLCAEQEKKIRFENCIHGEEEEVKAPYPSYKHLFGESIEQTVLRHSNDLINSLRVDIGYAKTIIQDLLNNSDEYVRQRAIDYLKEEEK